jgi:hypothetical protein
MRRKSSATSNSLALFSLETIRKLETRLEGAGANPFFDSLAYFESAQDAALQIVAAKVLREWGVLRQLSIRESTIHRFFHAVQAGYNENPYHGPAHGVDVTIRMIYILQKTGIVEYNSKRGTEGALQLLGAIVGTAIHDYDHPGTNNDYAVKMQLSSARQFNDQSVIENHSLFQALALMEDPSDCCLISGMSRSSRAHLRKNVISLVLATDMSKHFEIFTAFQTKVVSRAILGDCGLSMSSSNSQIDVGSSTCFSSLGADEQHLCLLMAIKVADIGHCALPMHLHLPWLQRLEEEFFMQGDKEIEAGLPVSPLMDRAGQSVNMPSSQVGFITIILAPLIEAFCKTFPSCKPLEDVVLENKVIWEGRSHSKPTTGKDSSSHSIDSRDEIVGRLPRSDDHGGGLAAVVSR